MRRLLQQTGKAHWLFQIFSIGIYILSQQHDFFYAIIHQAARFLYVKRGRGKLVIDGEEYVLQPNTLVAITPWKITDMVEVAETLQFIKVVYDYTYLNSVFKSVLGAGDVSAEPLRFLTVEPVAYLDSVQAEHVDGIMENLKTELGVESTRVKPPDKP